MPALPTMVPLVLFLPNCCPGAKAMAVALDAGLGAVEFDPVTATFALRALCMFAGAFNLNTWCERVGCLSVSR